MSSEDNRGSVHWAFWIFVVITLVIVYSAVWSDVKTMKGEEDMKWTDFGKITDEKRKNPFLISGGIWLAFTVFIYLGMY